MRSALVSLTLLSALALSHSARASTVDNFSITGLDISSNPYTISFSLDPASYSNNSGRFLYSDLSASVNGVLATLQLNISDFGLTNGLQLQAPGFFQTFQVNPASGTMVLTGDPSSGLPPTVTPGIYSATAFSLCESSLTMPATSLRLFPTLAFFQVPTIITCGERATVTVTPQSTSATPEPSTIALLGSGALGVLGVFRRRFLA